MSNCSNQFSNQSVHVCQCGPDAVQLHCQRMLRAQALADSKIKARLYAALLQTVGCGSERQHYCTRIRRAEVQSAAGSSRKNIHAEVVVASFFAASPVKIGEEWQLLGVLSSSQEGEG